jgi:hypothetical protein
VTSHHAPIKPNNGETIFSLLTREHVMSGRISPLVSLKEMTGHRGYKPLSSLPSFLGVICQKLDLGISHNEVINRHTLFNLYQPFLNPERRQFVIDGMIGSGATKSRMGLLKSHCGAADQLAYCCECAKTDIERLGFAYWHREHSLVGVEICPWHGVTLTKIEIESEKYGARNLQLPGNEPTVNFWTQEQYERLSYIAQQISIILNSHSEIYITASNYQHLLKAEQLVTASNHIRIRALKTKVISWLKPLSQIGVYKQLFSALNVERDWTANLVAGRDGLHHPLKHIVLLGAIGSDYQSFMDVLNGGEQLSLELNHAPRRSFTLDALLNICQGSMSARQASKVLGCSVNTALVLLQKSGLSPNRRPKKLTSCIIEKILDMSARGYSTRLIATETDLSISTINRVRRGHMGQ